MRSPWVAALVLLAGLSGTAGAQNVGRLPQATIALLPPVTHSVPATASTTARRTTYDTYYAPAPLSATPQQESTGPLLSDTSATNVLPGGHSTTAVHQPAPSAEARSAYSAWAGCEGALEKSGWSECDACNMDCGAHCGSGWFGTTGAVILTRNRGPAQVMTYQSGTSTPLMTLQAANAGWTGGGEVTLGYAFGGYTDNTGPWGALGANTGTALAFTWWGTGEMNGFAQVDDTTGVAATALDASFNVSGITINGNPFSYYFEDASSQRIYRSDIVNSAEINLLGGTLFSSERLQVIGLAGFRYFRFSEDLAFGSASFGNDWDDLDETAFVRFRSLNNLYGAQLGTIFNFNFNPEWSLFFIPKAGIYGNEMTVNSRIYSGNGDVGYDFTDDKSDVAFLGQIDTGINCHFRSNVYGYVGYRFVGAANVALGDNQFAPSLGDLKQSGSLILHGAFLGLGWLF
ncbi:MAG: hypothetical protein WD845_03265 [Pirellulales bacterium]